YLPELERCRATHVSIEAAQPKLDCSALRSLPSKTVVLGVLDLGEPAVEPAEIVAGRIRAALAHVPAERLIAAPDCGMKYLPRERALAKLRALAEGARRVRRERTGRQHCAAARWATASPPHACTSPSTSPGPSPTSAPRRACTTC